MTYWLKKTIDSEEWKEADTKKKMLMICMHLSSTQVKAERKTISGYGAIRMTKEEAMEMIILKVRYMNFWA